MLEGWWLWLNSFNFSIVPPFHHIFNDPLLRQEIDSMIESPHEATVATIGPTNEAEYTHVSLGLAFRHHSGAADLLLGYSNRRVTGALRLWAVSYNLYS